MWDPSLFITSINSFHSADRSYMMGLLYFKVLFSNAARPFTFRVNPFTSDMTQFYILIQLYIYSDTSQKTTFIKS